MDVGINCIALCIGAVAEILVELLLWKWNSIYVLGNLIKKFQNI